MALGGSSTCEDVAQAFPEGVAELNDGLAIVTGSSAGIGEETAFQLAKLGVHVIIAVRNTAKGEDKVTGMRARADAENKGISGADLKLEVMKIDTSDLESVKDFLNAFAIRADSLPPLKLLVCNAGIYANKASISKQGHELTFATNHVGHHLLTTGLIGALRATKGRVVVVSSNQHFGPLNLSSKTLADADKLRAALITPKNSLGLFAQAKVYGDSKFCNVLFAQRLHELETDQQSGITVAALHPGSMISTSFADEGNFIFRFFFKMARFFNKTVNQGASTTMYCSLASKNEVAGKYFVNCKSEKVNKLATKQAGELLWAISEDLVNEYRGDSSRGAQKTAAKL